LKIKSIYEKDISSNLSQGARCQIMNENKKEGTILKAALKAARVLSKANRAIIKDPHKLCDRCMNEYSWQTPDGLMLCNECNEEYINELETTMG
jgi:predicted Zn-ribbon and HTH transcriptional regulator